MGRLEEKMAQVAGIADRVTTHLVTRADKVLEREPKILARSNKYFDAKDNILNDAEKALDKAERALALLSNDPLPDSDSSGDSEVTALPDPPTFLNK